MDVSFLDSAAHVMGFDRIDKLLTHRSDFLSGSLSLADCSTDHQVSGSGALQISALILDAVAPPPVRTKPNRTTTRLMTRKKKRLRRRSMAGGGGGGGGGKDDDGFFGMDGGGGGGGGGFFGGGGGGDGGSGGWNYGGFGGNSWGDSSSAASDPASDFVYEVICWIALSNCVHFAFKRVVRGIGDLVAEKGREKLPMRLGSVC
uniref:Glycine-rich protein n=1 Tax=Kalanchoe fedtschenkoi TaxID=63787 RepID=A0A7N0UIM1_KALFE